MEIPTALPAIAPCRAFYRPVPALSMLQRLSGYNRPAAQTASFSRKIFALWRISTGKPGW